MIEQDVEEIEIECECEDPWENFFREFEITGVNIAN